MHRAHSLQVASAVSSLGSGQDGGSHGAKAKPSLARKGAAAKSGAKQQQQQAAELQARQAALQQQQLEMQMEMHSELLRWAALVGPGQWRCGCRLSPAVSTAKPLCSGHCHHRAAKP
jgi:hypothetical protein